jgi:glycine/D-amino acid oxidase-like deaminating enzyme
MIALRGGSRARAREPAVRSYWLREALAAEGDVAPAPALQGELKADVCIVGGGYTGLWTAINLRRLDPGADVVLLERDICGAGASGRNSGFIMSWWSKFSTLKKVVGAEAALSLCRASARAVGEIGDFCAEHEIEIDYRYDGWLWAASNRSQIGAWRTAVEELAAHGEHPFVELSAARVAELAGTPGFPAGVLEPTVATIQPARLARGLRRVAIEQGVRIFEGSPMVGLERTKPPVVHTRDGRVGARSVVLAINAWAARLPELRRKLVVISTDVLATEPIPDRLGQLGWTTGLGITDSRRLVNAYRPTVDGRLTLAKGGGTLIFAGRLGDRYDGPSPRVEEVLGEFRRVYPMLGDVQPEFAWRGPIDYAVSGMPYFGLLGGRDDLIVGVGYSGNGVGPSYLGGQLLAGLASGRRAGSSAGDALAREPPGRLPPEPLRYLGGRIVRGAIARREVMEDRGLTPGPLTRRVASLDPTSFIDRG